MEGEGCRGAYEDVWVCGCVCVLYLLDQWHSAKASMSGSHGCQASMSCCHDRRTSMFDGKSTEAPMFSSQLCFKCGKALAITYGCSHARHSCGLLWIMSCQGYVGPDAFGKAIVIVERLVS